MPEKSPAKPGRRLYRVSTYGQTLTAAPPPSWPAFAAFAGHDGGSQGPVFGAGYGRIESSNGVRDSTSAPVAVISTCCSSFTPSVPPVSPR